MPKSIYSIESGGNIYEVEADSREAALAEVQRATAPGTGSAVYGDTGKPITTGQEIALRAMGGINELAPEGTALRPRFQAPGGEAPEVGVYIDPRGKTVDFGSEPISKALLAAPGRLGARTLGVPVLKAANAAERIDAIFGALGGRPVQEPSGEYTPESLFPSDRVDAAESGAASGFLLGGKNELMATGDALKDDTPFAPAFQSSLATRDQRDKLLRENYPAEYYGGGAVGTVAGALITPELKGGQIALDAAIGGAAGLLSTDGDLKERAVGAALGTGAGAAGRLLASRAPTVNAPRKASPQQMLVSEGVTLTPGQAMGKPGRALESRLTSVPILGGGIKRAEQAAIEDLNRAGYNRVLGEIGESFPDKGAIGHGGVAYVDDQVSAAYDAALNRVQRIAQDGEFLSDIAQIATTLDELPDPVASGVRNALNNRIGKRFEPGVIDGKQWKQIDSELANLSRTYGSAADPLTREAANTIDDARTAMRGLLERTSPAAAEDVRKANKAFANLVRIQRAARGAPEGVFTPAQLDAAVRGADKSARGRASSRGEALMQDLSGAARTVMQPYPDSGTAGRFLPFAMGASAIAAPHVAVPAGIGLGVGRLGYSTGMLPNIATAAVKGGRSAQELLGKVPRLSPAQRALLARSNARAGGYAGNLIDGR